VKPLAQQPGLTEQVYARLLGEICEGALAPGTHLIQETLAAQLGVSRQPVQQALAILKSDGLLIELGKRGLFVAPLDVTLMQHHYEIRAALDGLAANRAAARAKTSKTLAADFKREGAALIANGEAAIPKGRVADLVRCDVAFHAYIYAFSGNPLLATTAEPHWRHLRRIMSAVLRHAEPPREIWRQHADILRAIIGGDSARAEQLAIDHVTRAAARLADALATLPPSEAPRERAAR
jgi:DNA-binding GntR family transcriptional regulator